MAFMIAAPQFERAFQQGHLVMSRLCVSSTSASRQVAPFPFPSPLEVRQTLHIYPQASNSNVTHPKQRVPALFLLSNSARAQSSISKLPRFTPSRSSQGLRHTTLAWALDFERALTTPRTSITCDANLGTDGDNRRQRPCPLATLYLEVPLYPCFCKSITRRDTRSCLPISCHFLNASSGFCELPTPSTKCVR